MSDYVAVTFSPVQGFIEKSRKLRDLYGASIILSYLSQQIVRAAEDKGFRVISPGLIDVAQGMPNRILLKGEIPPEELPDWVKTALLSPWRAILKTCKSWVETHVCGPYHWDRDWELWGTHAWEIFWGVGKDVRAAMDDLENRKLSRNWTGINWVGESSSITGTDAIAWPGLGRGSRNPKQIDYKQENRAIEQFYTRLSAALEAAPNRPPAAGEPQGKFLDPSERLSIPELVKRLITRDDIRRPFKEIPHLERFTELARKPDPENNISGQWTGWFMGDGDEVGKHLKKVADRGGDEGLKQFSEAMRHWGNDFLKTFPDWLGRVIYAGGDDFLGVIYSRPDAKEIKPKDALDWLMKFPSKWREHGQDIKVSVGFVWAGHSVPQRDVLQHCREAERRAKSLGRDRATLRVVFNSGQFVQWTCPWDYLELFTLYRDRDGGNNWAQIYGDLAQLKSRHAMQGKENYRIAIALMKIYFDTHGQFTAKYGAPLETVLLKNIGPLTGGTSPQDLIDWIEQAIELGWQLYSDESDPIGKNY